MKSDLSNASSHSKIINFIISGDTKRHVYFYAKANCKHSKCTSFKFIVKTEIIEPFEDKIVHVTTADPLCHIPNEIHRRFVKGSRRADIARKLEGKKPSIVKLDLLGSVPENVLKSGNRNDALSLMILQKISSENNTRDDLDKDVVMFLLKLKEKFIKAWPDRITEGYIQSISVDPFYVILFTGQQIDYLLSFPANGEIFLHLDATGRVVAKALNSTGPVMYYALTIPGSNEFGSLPVAEFISSVHSVLHITYFLSTFTTAIRKRTSREVVNKIEVDFSIALIQAVLKSFNDMNLSKYLEETYRLCSESVSSIPNFTIVHVCSTHILRTVKRKGNELLKDRRFLCAA